MSKRKDALKARVRYEKEPVEQYIIETYNWDQGDWNFIVSGKFARNADHPEAGYNWIPYGLLTKVVELAQLGYEIDM